jgi:hypothetical protein
MTETDDCCRYAVECERLAEIANDPKIKHELRALAQAWLQMDVSESSEGTSDGGRAVSQQTVLRPNRVSAGEG